MQGILDVGKEARVFCSDLSSDVHKNDFIKIFLDRNNVTIFNATDCKRIKIFVVYFREHKEMTERLNSPVTLYMVLIQTTIFWSLIATGCIGKIPSNDPTFYSLLMQPVAI